MQGVFRRSDDAGSPRSLGSRLIWLLALVPVIPVVIGIVLLAGAQRHAPKGEVMKPFAVSPPVVLTPPALPAPAMHRPGSTVAIVRHATVLYSQVGGQVIAPQPLHTTFGSPTVLLVRRTVPGWVGVVSPLAGNGRIGWLQRSAVTLTRINWTLKISLSKRLLTVLQGTKVREQYRIAIGKPGAPTPTGTFAVTDRLATGDSSGPYGCCIVALSAVAPHAIQGWGGGDRIAIHSTPPNQYWSIGQAISHGCMHVTLPQGQWLMGHVPLGTPTIIRS